MQVLQTAPWPGPHLHVADFSCVTDLVDHSVERRAIEGLVSELSKEVVGIGFGRIVVSVGGPISFSVPIAATPAATAG
jgi:hypothetical protein